VVLKVVHLLWGIRVFAGRKGGVDERVVGDGRLTPEFQKYAVNRVNIFI
jgi:hypothetical protein